MVHLNTTDKLRELEEFTITEARLDKIYSH